MHNRKIKQARKSNNKLSTHHKTTVGNKYQKLPRLLPRKRKLYVLFGVPTFEHGHPLTKTTSKRGTNYVRAAGTKAPFKVDRK